MADFTQKSTVKSAERKLASKIADLTTFNALVQDILDNNPWGCTTYQSAGVNKPAVEKSSQYFSGKVVYENAEAKTIGTVGIKANTSAGFTTANSDFTTAMENSIRCQSNGMQLSFPAMKRMQSVRALRPGLTLSEFSLNSVSFFSPMQENE